MPPQIMSDHREPLTLVKEESKHSEVEDDSERDFYRDYDPRDRVYSIDELKALNLVCHPIWIFDYVERRMRWANNEGLKMWNATSLEELQQRDFQGISSASAKRMEEYLVQFDRGLIVTDQWTNYPNGKAVTCDMNVSGIKFHESEDHMCVMCEGTPLRGDDLRNNNLRGVEMIRHLPMAVCQFDMKGKLMFQNPEASMIRAFATSTRSDSKRDFGNSTNQNSQGAPSSQHRSSTSSAASHHNHQKSSLNDMDNSSHTLSGSYRSEVSSDSISDRPYFSSQPPTPPSQSSNFPAPRPTTPLPCSSNVAGGNLSPLPHTGINSGRPKPPRSTSKTFSTHTSHPAEVLQPFAGDLTQRFVDPKVGIEVLEEIAMPHVEKVDTEALIKTRKGNRWSAIQLRKGKDPITGETVILYSANDISDKIKAKEERKAREQKSEFLAIMAHEIRTPLHQVTGFIDLLDQTDLDSEQKSFVRLLKSSAQGLMTVISDVLDYSKLEAGKMKLERIPFEPLSVVEGSMEAMRAACEERGLYLNLEWNKTIPFKVKGDPNRLRQILLNLLSNAVKFTEEGGISVKALPMMEALPSNDKHMRKSFKERPVIRYEVSDTGMGIGEDCKSLIFQKYVQANAAVARNFGGTGLGLSICQLLVQSMGGQIGVESQLGVGTTFWVVLPADVPNDVDSLELVEDEAAEVDGGLHILLAEDNKINQKLAVQMLRRMGHTADIATNGKEAIHMVESSDYDAILMDIQMPVMDGIEATRRIRTLGYADLPIFGLTASVARSDFADLGFDAWLPKPIPMKELRRKLSVLRRQKSDQALTIE